MKKMCSKCKEIKPLRDFYPDKKSKDGHSYWCAPCSREYQREWRRRNSDKYARYKERWNQWYGQPENRARRMEAAADWRRRNPERAKYNRRKHTLKEKAISPEDYDWLLAAQGGRCAICARKSARTLHVDHDHHTGKIRGLLCDNCNLGMGHFQDDPGLITKALQYLEEASDREAVIVRQASLDETMMQDLRRKIVIESQADPEQSEGSAGSAR